MSLPFFQIGLCHPWCRKRAGGIHLLLILTFLLLTSSNQLWAHHGTFYKSLFKAIKASDLQSVKGLFTDVAWKGGQGKDAGLSAEELERRLKTRVQFKRLGEYSSYAPTKNQIKDKNTPIHRPRTVIVFQLQTKDEQSTLGWVFLLGEHQAGKGSKPYGNLQPQAWRVVNITENQQQAELFLGRKFLQK